MHKRSLAWLIVTAVATIGMTGTILVIATPGISQAARPTKLATPFYLSLGDSWSVGYQPDGTGGVATAGYTGYVAKKLKMQLENFGCAGATSTSLTEDVGCASPFGPPAGTGAVAYPTTTQKDAALDFIGLHPGGVGLITVSIGGNDIIPCATALDQVGCIEAADATITASVGGLVDQLSSALTAAGDIHAQIIGQSYLDTFLSSYVNPGGTTGQNLASLSLLAFDDFFNPTLEPLYTSVPGGSFLDMTSAPYRRATSGADTPFVTTEKLSGYGSIPAAVAEVCQLTYQCSELNGHPNDKGYTFIGKLIVADYQVHA